MTSAVRGQLRDGDAKLMGGQRTEHGKRPIAVPGESALVAVAEPTSSDYLFFLSGDDDKTYFGRTQAEHERNIEQHCQQKCLIL